MNYLSLDGRRLGYLDNGVRGSQVMLLLHSLGTDHRLWGEQIPELVTQGFRVVAPDSRGHGSSDWAPLDNGSADWAHDLRLLLDHLSLETVHVWGVSMGCAQAFALAREVPAAIRSIVVSGAIPGLEEEAAAEKVAALADGARRSGMSGWASQYVEGTLITDDPDKRTLVRETVAQVSLEAYRRSAAACFDRRPGDLAEVAIPTLILWGTKDVKTPRHMSAALCQQLPNARLVELPDGGHLAPLDVPVSFAAAASSFSRAHRTARTSR